MSLCPCCNQPRIVATSSTTGCCDGERFAQGHLTIADVIGRMYKLVNDSIAAMGSHRHDQSGEVTFARPHPDLSTLARLEHDDITISALRASLQASREMGRRVQREADTLRVSCQEATNRAEFAEHTLVNAGWEKITTESGYSWKPPLNRAASYAHQVWAREVAELEAEIARLNGQGPRLHEVSMVRGSGPGIEPKV